MYYELKEENKIEVPKPYKRSMIPLFMGDDPVIRDCAFSIHVTEWEKDGRVDLHTHDDGTEAMFCMEGCGEVNINGEKKNFSPGCMIVAPPGVLHSIRNTGDELLRVLCVFSPPVTAKKLKDRAMDAVLNG